MPSSSMTYYLKGGEIVEARVAPSPAEIAWTKLRWLGVQVFRTQEGAVMGQLELDPATLAPLDGARITRLQRFKVVGDDQLQLLAPSPLARCRPLRFLDSQSHDDLVGRVQRRWTEVVEGAQRCLQNARCLASDAHLLMDPWRIEGTRQVGHEEVRVLFSSDGGRACICGLNGRALVVQPANPRIIIPVQTDAGQEEQVALWRAALEQARSCLGHQPQPASNNSALSIDLLSQDLEASYVDPAPAAPQVRVGAPARTPPPRPPIAIKRSPPPPPRPPGNPALRSAAALQPANVEDDDSLDLTSLDLSLDLASGDLPD